jgi:hypothetical protein
MVQPLFFFGAKGKELRGYGTISKQKNWQKRENILRIWDNPFFFWFSGEGTLKYWNTKAASTHVNKKYSMSKIKHFKRFLNYPSQFLVLCISMFYLKF